MKIIVIGGTGLIGSKLVTILTGSGHQAIAASPNSGVNTLTGEGLADVLDGADVVVDVSNSPSFEDSAVLEFFETSTRNLLAAEADAGVRHHVALSVVGTQKLAESGYFRAKIAQEKLISTSDIPYTIVHATQFFEFITSIAHGATVGDTVRLSSALIQPMAADDVAQAVATAAVDRPVDGIIEIAGPDRLPLADLVRHALTVRKDPRTVAVDETARYFGALLTDDMLLPGPGAQLGTVTLDEWLTTTDTGH